MQCLHPLWIEHPTLKKLRRYNMEHLFTEDSPIPIPCGKCLYCMRRKSNDWRLRLIHEWKLNSKNCWFVTLTIDPEHYTHSVNPSVLMRSFWERIRHRTGKSVRHWFITELGEDNHRLHYHGLVFDCNLSYNEFRDLWKYGFVWIGWCSERSINYVVKYMLKPSPDKDFRPRVYCTRGIGKSYITEHTIKLHNRLHDGVFYCVVNGFRYTLPRYYRSKLFPEDWLQSQRELMGTKCPELRFNGVLYTNFEAYCKARQNAYNDSLLRGTSLPSFTDFNASVRQATEQDADNTLIVKPPKYIVTYYGTFT